MYVDVAEGAAPRRLPVAPPDERRRLVGEEVGVEADPGVDEVAELAGADHLAGDGVNRVVRKIVSDEIEDPGFVDRADHVARLVRVPRERLLAVDVLAGGGGREGHLPVQVVRGDDVDDVDVRVRDRLAPVGGPAPGAAVGRHLLGQLVRRLHHELEDRTRRVVAEDDGGGGIDEGMGLPHPAGPADERDSNFPHGLPPLVSRTGSPARAHSTTTGRRRNPPSGFRFGWAGVGGCGRLAAGQLRSLPARAANASTQSGRSCTSLPGSQVHLPAGD